MTAAAEAELERRFWNDWNAAYRENRMDEVPRRQGEIVLGWLAALGREGDGAEILEVGCGAGWLCGALGRHGRVTATDLSDEVLARARARNPDVRFVTGDFMRLDFGEAAYDAVVTLEVLAHVADQPAFLAKIARHLKPGGHLLLATQNRPVLERHNRLPPPAPGQRRRWVDRDELAALLAPEFETLEMFTATPKADRGLMRLVNSYKLNLLVRAVAGDRVERLKERAGLGWTIMALARRRR